MLEAQVAQLGPRVEQAQQTWFALSSLAERVRGTIGLAEARVRHAQSPGTEERRGRDPEEMEREAARIREEEAELKEALEEAQYALAETVELRSEPTTIWALPVLTPVDDGRGRFLHGGWRGSTGGSAPLRRWLRGRPAKPPPYPVP